MNDDEYIPVELFKEAGDFIRLIDENVSIYKTIKNLDCVKPCIEADKFMAYWNLGNFNNYPHALITLYESMEDIDNSLGVIDAQNAFDCLQFKMKSYYLILKENNLIGE